MCLVGCSKIHNEKYYVNTVECFDPDSNTWQTMSPMPVPLDWGHSIVTFGGSRCYVIGIDLTKHRDQTDKLNPV